METKLINIFNEEILKTNMNASSFIICLYEAFQKLVVDTVQFPYVVGYDSNGKVECSEKNDDIRLKKYIGKNGKSHPDLFRSSVDELVSLGVFSEDEGSEILRIRDMRNGIAHELFDKLYHGLTEDDGVKTAHLLGYYFHLDNWKYRQYTYPLYSEEMDKDIDITTIQSVSAQMLLAIYHIVIEGRGKEYWNSLQRIIGEQQ